MEIINVDIMPDGSVEVTGQGFSSWLHHQPRRTGNREIWHINISNDEDQKVVITDCRGKDAA